MGTSVRTLPHKLMPMQEAILYDCAMLDTHAVYTVEVPLTWQGAAPEPERLSEAFRKALDRHDAFGMRIVEANGPAPWAASFHPLSNNEIISASTDRAPIDPFREGCIQLLIERQEEGETILIIRFHHVVADRPSIELLVRDFFAIYMGDTPLPAGDYHRSVSRILELYADERTMPPVVDEVPPPDWQRPVEIREGVRVARAEERLCAADWLRLESAAQQSGILRQSLVLAAYGAVLSRLSGRQALRIGVPVSLRDMLDETHTAGCFMSLSALMIKQKPEAGFLEFTRGVQDQLLDGLSQRWAPLLRDDTNGHAHTTTTVFAWHEPFIIRQGGYMLTLGMPGPYPARLVQSLLAQPGSDGLHLALDYDPSLLTEAAAKAILTSVRRVLEAAAADPDILLTRIALSPPPARVSSRLAEVSIHDRIGHWMKATPQATAVIDGDGKTYDYAALQCASEHIAQWATSATKGVIGLHMEGSFAFVAALLGLLRSGRSLALLDPGASPQLLRANMDAARIGCILSDKAPILENIEWNDINILINNLSEGRHDLPASTQGELILFSSGTTGAPKPIVLATPALYQHTLWAIEHFGLTPADRVLQFCSVAFDAMLEEVLPTLAAGATLVIRDALCTSSPDHFFEYCDHHKISVVDLPTGFFNLLAGSLDTGAKALPPSLRLTVIGGESYTANAARNWKRAHPQGKLITTYGPAEATVVVASEELDDSINTEGPLVGRPRPGCALYVLDKELNPLPAGIAGDLYIGGNILANGYFLQAARTARNFVPDPFALDGGRMYRTGDRVVQDEEGRLIFLGRSDRQLKLLGMRILPDAIEERVMRAFGGAPCAIVPYGSGQPRIALFIQSADTENAESRIREALADLPAAASPTLIRFEPIPLTTRGKTDRAALQARLDSAQHSQPATLIGDEMRGIIADVLGHANFSDDDDFFSRGGHSLAVLQLITKMKRSMKRTLRVSDIYKARTIGRIAELIKSTDAMEEPATMDDPWIIGELEQAILVDEQLTNGPSPYWIEERWQLSQPLDPARLQRALRSMLAQNPLLRVCTVTPGSTRWEDRDPETAIASVLNGQDGYLHITPDQNFLTIRVHHALLDGQGLERLAKELAQAYTHDHSQPAYRSTPPPALRPIAHTEEWRQYLDGLTALPLPPPDSRGSKWDSAANAACALLDFSVDKLLVHGDGAKNLFGLALSLVACWLHRMTGAHDLAIGFAAGDSDGLRLSTSVALLRSRIKNGDSFSGVHASIRENLHWILDRLPVHPARLASLLRDTAGPEATLPLLFDVQDKRQKTLLHFDDTTAMPKEKQPDTVRKDLELSMIVEEDGRLAFSIRARAALYSTALLEHWATSFKWFAAQLLQAPHTAFHSCPLIDNASTAAAVVLGSTADASSPLPVFLRAAFERLGDAIAAKSPSIAVTGTDSLAAASALTARLQSLGAAGKAVGLELPRHPIYPAALLGIWEAGAVPVLINPAQPPARRTAMYGNTQPAAIVRLSDEGSIIVEETEKQEAAMPAPGSFHHLSYISFTSGSKGEPKPVAVPWRGLEQLLAWSRRTVEIQVGDAFLHLAAPGFDISLWEQLFPLLGGLRLLVADESSVGNIESLIRFAEREKATHLHFIPSLLQAFLDALKPSEGRQIRLIFCGGESTPPALQKRLLEERGIPMQHCYGPTEASIFALSWHGNHRSPWPDRLPLGAPTDGAGIAILDESGMPVVHGIAGQLGIFGEALAAGYLYRPRETAAAFRPWPGNGGRIYLTGDYALMHADGAIEYRGRNDRQVKISGVRIELGEIESVLASIEGVARALVVFRKEENKPPYFIAYIKKNEGQSSEKLQSMLEAAAYSRLPMTVISLRYVFLAEFPLNLNGKIDLKALPEPNEKEDRRTISPVDLAGSEALLHELWCAALGRSGIDVNESFFRIGGDSITAIRITALARKRGLVTSLADFFRHPSIRVLAAAIDSRKPAPIAASHEPATVVPGPAAQRWLAQQKEIGTPDDDGIQTVLLRLDKEIDSARMLAAWHFLLARHEALSLACRYENGRWNTILQSPQTATALPLATDAAAALEETARQLRPAEGKMLGMAVADNHLAVAIHHLAVDPHAWAIVLDDLKTAYTDISAARNLPAVIPFRQWCARNKEAGSIHILSEGPRTTSQQQLSATAADFIGKSGGRRKALLIAAVAEALAEEFFRTTLDIDLEEDGRQEDEGNWELTVGWLTGFRTLHLSQDWLETATTALLQPTRINTGTHCVLNIVSAPPQQDEWQIVARTENTRPTHPLAIEIELLPGEVLVSVDCDGRYPPDAAASITNRISHILDRYSQKRAGIPLTPLQEAMLSAQLRNPGSQLYHTQILLAPEGLVDPDRMKSAWQEVMMTHDAFRCRIALDGTSPLIHIDPDARPDWTEKQESDLPVDELLEQTLATDLARPFDLTTGHCSRLYWLEGRDGVRFLWSHHHLFFDGCSLNLVLQSLARIYTAQGAALPTAPSIAELNNWWAPHRTDGIEKWTDRLLHIKPPPALPLGNAQPARMTLAWSLPEAGTRKLDALSQHYRCSAFELVLCAWSLAWAHQSRTRDVLFGVVVTVRPAEITQAWDIVGLCMNTLPFCVKVEESFTGLLGAVRESLGAVLETPCLSTAELFASLRKQGWTADMQSVVVFENYPGDRDGVALGSEGYLRVLPSREQSEVPFTLVALPGTALGFELLVTGGTTAQALGRRLLQQLERVLNTFINLTPKE